MHRLLDSSGIRGIKRIPGRTGQYGNYSEALSPVIVNGLKKSGIERLYLHQLQAIENILVYRNTVITTSTSSGKSLVYTLPVLNAFLSNSETKAVYLTPAKALGQNQRKTIQDISDRIEWPGLHPVISICDGDTPGNTRQNVLKNSNIIVTTPDMLHYSLLPGHSRYKEFFQSLKYVIIDEAHTYRGIFGNNVCHVIRRLRRVCDYYGASPVFILCTATIANPEEFAKNLVGLDFAVVSKDTSPSGRKTIAFYEPPSYYRGGQEVKKLVHYEAARALGQYIRNGYRGIVFAKSRKLVENMYAKLQNEYPDLTSTVTPYKGTYAPEARREIEAGLFSGKLKGVITTNALELGIDIGDLNLCILSGFPGSISSAWQQFGRAGRKGQDALVVLMASEDPLDIFLVRNSSYFFGQPFEKAVVSPEKPQFVIEHLMVAANEFPLAKADSKYWDEKVYYRAVDFLYKAGNLNLIEDGEKKYFPAVTMEKFGLRGDSDQYRAITPDGKLLEQYEYQSLLTDAYPGAIISVRGKPFQVKSVDFQNKQILLNELPWNLRDYSTKPDILEAISEVVTDKEGGDKIKAFTGTLKVNRILNGYIVIDPKGASTACDLPQEVKPYVLQTTGIWLDIPGADFDSLHALEHLLRVVVPWLVMCDRRDLGAQVDGNRVYLYDNYQGGVGLAESALGMIDQVFERALEVVSSCKCAKGCPSCIHIPQCVNRNEKLSKLGVIRLLYALLKQGMPPVNVKNAGSEGIKSRTELRLAARNI